MAEQLAAAHMRELGFLDARVTRDGADGGLDVTATDAAAQVKYVSAPVGSPDVQRLRGAAHGISHVLFYSASGYSSAGLKVAAESLVALFEFDETNNVRPVNDLAIELATRTPMARAATAKRVGALVRWSRSITFALADLFKAVQAGEIVPWAEISDDVDHIDKGVGSFMPVLPELEAALDALEVERALTLLQPAVVFADEMARRMEQRPSEVARFYFATQAAYLERFDAEHDRMMAEA